MAESSPQLLRLVLDRLQEGVIILDADGRVVDANPAAEAILGLRSGTLLGVVLPEVAREAFDARGRRVTWEEWPTARALAGEDVDATVLTFRGRGGRRLWIEVEAGPVRGPEGRVTGAVVTFTDVTEHAERERRFRHEAYHDHLTGLPNRRLFERTLKRTIARAVQSGRGVALLLVDLDGFKAINDRLGHLAGDAVLRVTADRLRRSLRERDLVARLGGDEFVIVLADLQEPEEVAASFAQRVREAFGEPMEVEGRPLHVSATVGTACYPRDGTRAADLLAHADREMYARKPNRPPRAS